MRGHVQPHLCLRLQSINRSIYKYIHKSHLIWCGKCKASAANVQRSGISLAASKKSSSITDIDVVEISMFHTNTYKGVVHVLHLAVLCAL